MLLLAKIFCEAEEEDEEGGFKKSHKAAMAPLLLFALAGMMVGGGRGEV